jgi:hypothetical protein
MLATIHFRIFFFALFSSLLPKNANIKIKGKAIPVTDREGP